jgi:hypothetical protein
MIIDGTYHLDADGNRRATHSQGRRVSLEQAKAIGRTRHLGGVKHRYVYILGNKTQRKQRRNLLKLPVLPYPKADAA